jgi:glutathione S-transferase
MAEYRLHCFAQSGNAYKVALGLQLAGLDWEPLWVDFFNGGTRTPEYRAINVMGEAPVLEHRGERISQSGAILDYLSAVTGRFDAGPENAREALRWLLWENQKFSGMLGPWRAVARLLPADKRNPDVVAFLEGRARGALAVLNTHLADRDWIVGDGLTTVDLSCAGYVFYEDDYPIDWATEYPNIDRWRDWLRAEPGWAHPNDLMPGHPTPGAA